VTRLKEGEYRRNLATVADFRASLIGLRSWQLLLLVLVGSRFCSWRQLR
jgi:hypothetical protein